MIPILYDSGETLFTSNGLGRLSDCISCTVTEERNGIYECEFEYPISGRMYREITEGRIIGCTHDDNRDIQPFDIYGRSAPINGVVTFYAHHISYRLRNVILKPFTADSCAAALAKFATETYSENPFTFWTDKAVTALYKLSVPASAREMLAGVSGSILDVYGKGEYKFDKWAVRLYVNRGTNSGVKIKYGVNLRDIEHETDYSGIYNAYIPFWASADDGSVVTLPEGVLIGPNVRDTLTPWTTQDGANMENGAGEQIYFSVPNVQAVPLDLSGAFDEEPTVEQLRNTAQSRINNSEAYQPTENITVDFVALWQTAEYANYAPLQRLGLCDRATVQYYNLGVNATMQIIRTVYNTLTDRFDSMELGTARTSYAEALTETLEAQVLPKFASRSMLEAAVNHATDMITGGLGGYVIFKLNADGQPEEILIMDTPDTATAVNVWRFNRNGLGHSSTGYNGPFSDIALTADGQINASMITAGTLNANVIRAGVISDVNGRNTWDLLSGAFSMTGGTIDLQYPGSVFGFHVGPYGDIAIGGKPDNMSSFEGNKTPLQFNNQGQIKATTIYIYGRAATSDNYIKYGEISGDAWTVGNQNLKGILLKSANGYATIGINDNGVYIDKFVINAAGDYTQYVYDATAGNALAIMNGSTGFYYLLVSNVLIRVLTNVMISGDLTVTGTKNRAVKTATHGTRKLYAYETAAPYFGDIGEDKIGPGGRCVVEIDPIFAETIAVKGYQVFLTPYGRGECFVAERDAAAFVVEGSPGLRFAWEIKGRQIDYKDTRLEGLE